MISQDHIIKWPWIFKGGSASLYATIFSRLLATGIALVEMFLICHVISQDVVIKGSRDFMGRSPLKLVISRSSMVPIGIVVVVI